MIKCRVGQRNQNERVGQVVVEARRQVLFGPLRERHGLDPRPAVALLHAFSRKCSKPSRINAQSAQVVTLERERHHVVELDLIRTLAGAAADQTANTIRALTHYRQSRQVRRAPNVQPAVELALVGVEIVGRALSDSDRRNVLEGAVEELAVELLVEKARIALG